MPLTMNVFSRAIRALRNEAWKVFQNLREVFCRNQLDSMLDDRPGMAALLEGQSALREWFRSQFAGEITGFRITWDPREPEFGPVAEHMDPQRGKPAYIRVSRRLSAINQLSVVVFELHNIRFFQERRQLWKKACRGRVSREEFNSKSIWLEYQALIESSKFLKQHSSVFDSAGHDDFVYWRHISCPSLSEWTRGFQRRNGNSYYENVFDLKVKPHLEKRACRKWRIKRYLG